MALNHSPSSSLFSLLSSYSIHKKLPYSSQTILITPTPSPSLPHFLLLKQLHLPTTLQFKQAIQSLQSHILLSHPHLLSLLDYTTSPHITSTTNKTTHKITTLYSYSSHNLLEQVNDRISERRPFEENEIWNILCSVVFALAYLQRQQIAHGCISLLDIFITPSGIPIICDPSISSIPPSQFHQGYYYSPQMFQFFTNPNIPPEDIDIYRSDVFSLGLCMLHVAGLDELDRVMDYENWCVNFEELEEKVREVGERYGEELGEVLVWMLAEGVEERPDFEELEEWLVQVMNSRDQKGGNGILRGGDVTLSMQFESLHKNYSQLQSQPQQEDNLLQPTLPQPEDIQSPTFGIPIVDLDCQTIDLTNQSQITYSIAISFQKPNQNIIITESLSFHNTSRSDMDKKRSKEIEEIEEIVFKKGESKKIWSGKENEKYKESEPPRESLLSEIEMMVKSSKDNMSLVNNLLPISSVVEDTVESEIENKQIVSSKITEQKQEEKKTEGVGPAKGVSRKWNVPRQVPKTENKIKTIIAQQPQNQRNKLNSIQTANRFKKTTPSFPTATTTVTQTKIIKRAKPIVKSPAARVPPQK